MIAGTNNVEGSPPHGRGKVDTISNNSRARRITPAWAGKSHASLYCNRVEGDHPRMGGEKLPRCGSVYPWQGSPPHGRGKGGKLSGRVRPKGITPAWAGKRPGLALLLPRAGDHPRMGGEKSASSWRWISSRGSPPHGRGKACRSCCGHTAAGITPAWAGKRATPTKNGCSGGDHPRMGGEKPGVCYTQCAKRGSPPHGRGKVYLGPQLGAGYGITPAWAGKSINQEVGGRVF